jgi:hypothetical protein
MLVLAAAANKKFDRRERRPGRHINDGDFVIYGSEPRIARHHNRAECQQRDYGPGFISEASQESGPRRGDFSAIWLRDQVAADAAGEKESGQVRELLLNSNPLRRPRNPARNWYHLCGTIFNGSLNETGRPQTKIIVNSKHTNPRRKSRRRMFRTSLLHASPLFYVCLGLLLCALPAMAQPQQVPPAPAASSALPDAPTANVQPAQQLSGNVSGTVVDPSGAAVAGAHVTLMRDDKSQKQEVLSSDDGQFSFAGVAPGPFQITITSELFTTQKVSAILHPGEILVLPQIVFGLATEATQVQVNVPLVEVAEEELKVEEKQRIFGVIPNFYVSYVPNAAPLASKQKFQLAWRSTVDPVNFAITGAIAGVQQATNTFSGYGQGAQGYGKRYGASYADLVTGTFLGSAILPSLLKQDPRYFYKGTGSVRSRVLYAIANSVICKGDNGHWQPNYSGILGSLAAGGISNLYYPAQNRDGAALTVENTLIGIGETAATNLLQEFVIRKLTPNLSHQLQTNTP